nr:bifunctional hydroxymethylpyrimidine kinase/phosphomethylpyrimidine kinase [Liquorilactobacillus satsumensis]
MGETEKGYLVVAEDLSALGGLSTTAAYPPILAAQDVPVALLPTGIMSTQSEGFGVPVKLATASWIAATLKHWQDQHVPLHGALLGYIDSEEVSKILHAFLTKVPLKLVIIDPVLADEGLFYPELTANQVHRTIKLLRHADFSTPNVTEACFLTGERYLEKPTVMQQKQLLQKIQLLMKPTGRAVITGIRTDDRIGCAWLENGEVKHFFLPQMKGHFYGSGDAFAAVLTGQLWNGASLTQAVCTATQVTYNALQQVVHAKSPRQYGLKIAPLIRELLTKKQK